MLAVATCLDQVWRCLVNVLGEADVLHADFACTTTTAHMGCARLGHAPAPGGNIDLFGMYAVYGFAIYTLDFQKHVYGHLIPSVIG